MKFLQPAVAVTGLALLLWIAIVLTNISHSLNTKFPSYGEVVNTTAEPVRAQIIKDRAYILTDVSSVLEAVTIDHVETPVRVAR